MHAVRRVTGWVGGHEREPRWGRALWACVGVGESRRVGRRRGRGRDVVRTGAPVRPRDERNAAARGLGLLGGHDRESHPPTTSRWGPYDRAPRDLELDARRVGPKVRSTMRGMQVAADSRARGRPSRSRSGSPPGSSSPSRRGPRARTHDVTWFPAVGGRNGCVWVSWWRTTFQVRALAGSGPSSGSLAEPVSVIVSPTEKRCPASGPNVRRRGVVAGVDPDRRGVGCRPCRRDTVKRRGEVPARVRVVRRPGRVRGAVAEVPVVGERVAVRVAAPLPSKWTSSGRRRSVGVALRDCASGRGSRCPRR